MLRLHLSTAFTGRGLAPAVGNTGVPEGPHLAGIFLPSQGRHASLACGRRLAQAAPVHKPGFRLVGIVTLVVLLAAAGFGLWRLRQIRAMAPGDGPAADAPLPLPASGAVDHRLDFPSAWLTAQIPRAVRMDPPLGTEHGGLAYNAQPFWEMNDKRGGRHLGDDLNGIGGMDTDLGDPVFAVADGLVVFAGQATSGWGNIVVIAHRAPDGHTLHSMVAHLDRIDVSLGTLVARGGRVGTVGTANGFYPAHLHFEMRASDGVDIGAGYAMIPRNRLDPSATVAALRNAAPADLAPSPLARMLTADGAP